jgi:hypothetical protein
MTQGFVDDEDKCLCEAWLATTHDCINGVQQKGKVYWTKVLLQYNETKMHPPYNIPSPWTEESSEKDGTTSNKRQSSSGQRSNMLRTTP